MNRLRESTARVAALVVLMGSVFPGLSLADEALSRPLTVQNSGDAAPPVERADGRAFSLLNAGAVAGPVDVSRSRPFTFQNLGLVGVIESALARVWTLQNMGGSAPPRDDAIARAFTLQNVGPSAPMITESLARAFTAQYLELGGQLSGDESIARAFTVRQLGESFAPGPNEAIARAVSVQNLGFLEEPGIEEVIGRAFTAQNAGDVTDVPDVPRVLLPASFQLYTNTPNPARARTSIRYDLPRTSPVSIRMYDVTGRLVKILVHSKKHEPGRFVIDWDGLDQDGRSLASGVYFYRMRADGFEQSRRLVLVRD
jgi:hypothetical protein